jgi:adenylate cyclase
MESRGSLNVNKNTACILVVDDNLHNVDMLVRRLQRTGYSVTSAYGGKEAIDKIDNDHYDLVVLDIMMPEVNGIQVLEYIRKTKNVSELPVIMATAKDQSEDIVEAMNSGANDYVTKPIDYPVLVARIQTQLALKFVNDENTKLLKQLEDRNEFIKSLFGRFISDDVVEQLLETPTGTELGGELRDLSILFADIRGFTSLSETLTPEQVVTLLNNYLGTMTDIIDSYGGTVNEFYGDGLLAFFGAPVPREDHARIAVQCALAMKAGMEEVNRRNRECGLPEIDMGVAVNSGEVVVGNVGSEKRFKYGVIGSAVNIASRVQGNAENGTILVTRSCVDALGDCFEFADHQHIQVKGLSQPIEICRVVGE